MTPWTIFILFIYFGSYTSPLLKGLGVAYNKDNLSHYVTFIRPLVHFHLIYLIGLLKQGKEVALGKTVEIAGRRTAYKYSWLHLNISK